MVRKFVVMGALFLAMLGTPRTSEAGLFDFIWEMSGPQMIGAGFGCLFTRKEAKREECRIGGVPPGPTVTSNEARAARKPGEQRNKLFFSLNGGYYLSTGHDSTEKTADNTEVKNGYDWQDVQMLAGTAGIAYRSMGHSAESNWRIHHGVGGTYNFLFGRHFQAFDKAGLTFAPIDVAYKRISVGFTARLYPNGFTRDEFGLAPRVTYDRKREWVYGFNVGWALPEKKCPCPKSPAKP